MECPKHNIPLLANQTQFGLRHQCPEPGCTVVCWDGQNSTPADKETRDARMEAHKYFDRLWPHQIERKEAYRLLAEFLGLSCKDTHIGYFDKEVADKVVVFAKALPMQILKERYK